MKATITFDTNLTQDELTSKLQANLVLSVLATDFGAYPVVTVEAPVADHVIDQSEAE